MVNIDIHVETEFLAEHSDLMRDHYVFAYHIRIENRGREQVVLRRRHWQITDALGGVEVVDGMGVVGEEPALFPGDSFSYSSNAQLHTPWGEMRGRYQFERADGSCFWAQIPAFDLKAPFTLQ